jgi:hypothetical protein
MSNIQVNRVTNANVYVDGRSYLGRVEEMTLPTVKQIMAEHKALGMNGKFELPAGVDKLEARLKWNSFYPEAMTKFANPNVSIQLQIRSSLKTWGSSGVLAEVPVVVHLTCQSKDFPTGAFKQHDNVELESMLACTYCKLVVNGQEIMEIDVLANIHKVNGADILAAYRANLGI